MNLFDLSGKYALVTGAGGGLGQAMAEGLMEAGASVALLDISPKVTEISEKYNLQGFKTCAVVADISSKEGIEDAYKKAISIFGQSPDILVNAAGIQRRAFCEEFSLEDWNDVIQMNLTSVFILCQLAGRDMIKKGYGKIINIASMLSFFGGYTVPAYSASKGGVAQLTKALSNEWAKKGINVNAIAPGYMDTQMNTKLIQDEARNRQIVARIPAGRWGEPQDLKGITIFLSAHASDYLNGAVIPVDGGYLGC